MSDLHIAVQAEIDAHRPHRVPPFDALLTRRRDRGRRRTSAAMVASAVVAAGIALLPAALHSGTDREGGLGSGEPGGAAPIPRQFQVSLTFAGSLN